MKAHLSLEYIGATIWDEVRQFDRLAGRIIPAYQAGLGGLDRDDYMSLPGPRVLAYKIEPDGLIVSRVRGQRDYSRANSKGTRGVTMNYILEEGVLYQVKSPTSWRSSERYFATVTPGGEIARKTKEEALEWARSHWG